MKFDLTLGISDKPGQLIRALEPVAKHGGNIITVMHEREKPAEGFVPVRLVVDFPSDQNFRKMVNDLQKMDIAIIRSEEVVEKARITLILIGKMDLKRIIETRIEGVRVVGFEVSAPTSKESSVKIDLEVPVNLVDRALEQLKRVSREEKALLIPSV